MVKYKILIVSGTFFPDNTPRSFRTTELAKEFGRLGHDVTVLIPGNTETDYSDFEKNFAVTIKKMGKQRLPVISGAKKGLYGIILRAFRRLLLMLFEYPSIELMPQVKKALSKEDNYDLLISIAWPYPIHWGVAWSRNKKHKIAKLWIADCGDPYMGCKTDSFKKLFYFRYLENWFSRKADYISIPNIDHLDLYYPEFAPKIRFIPQGFRFEDANLYKGEIKNKVPTFAFAGVLLKVKRDPTPFLEYLSSIKKDFKFILYIQNDELVTPFKILLGERIEVRQYIPRDKLIYILSQMDFLLNIEFHSSVISNSPSKLIDYAIAERPILSLSMERLDKNLIDEFLSGNYSNKMRLDSIDRFRIENVAKQFLDFI